LYGRKSEWVVAWVLVAPGALVALAGVASGLYCEGVLHAKVMHAYNFFAAQMEEMFEMDKTVSEEVTLEGWEDRPLHARLIEGALAPIWPFG
jgi:hypothetical protein